MNIYCHCHGTFAGLYVSHKCHIIRTQKLEHINVISLEYQHM